MAEDSTQLPGGAQTGDILRMEAVTVASETRLQQVATLADADGALITSSLDGANQGLDVHVANLPSTQPVSGTVEITNDVGNPVPVSGSVSVSNLPATQPVSGTVAVSNFPASQPVTGAFYQATQPVSGTVAVSNLPATQPVSAASLPLPAGAATEATLASVKTGTDKIPASPSQEHTTAASPSSVRLTDGSAFYKATTPSDTQPVSGTVAVSGVSGVVHVDDNGSTLSVDDGAGSLTVDGTVAVSTVTSITNVVHVDDNSAALSVDDNGASLTVDGSVAVTGEVDVTPASPAAGDYLPVRLTDGASFYNATGGGGGSGGTSQVDKAAFVEGTGAFTPVGGTYNETISADPTEDQAAAVRITAKRAMHANLRSAAGTEIGTSGTPLRTDPTGTTAQPVTDNGGSLTVDGTVAATQSGTWNVGTVSTVTNVVHVDDNGGTLSIDDGAGSLTVDGSVSITGTPSVTDQHSNKTADYDSGAGTDTVTMYGVALPASGGAVAGGTSTNPLRTDPTGATTQPVSAASLPLPAGAATETTLAAIKTGTDKIPTSPAQEHATAASPASLRLSDGAAFYKATTPSDTQPVSAASLPLPAGAATSAKQPAPGTAGAASADVITVQGVASMTPVKTDGSAVTQPVSGTLAVTNAGTFAVQDSQVVADNAAFTDGTTKVQPVGYIFDEVAGTALTENDAAAARIDSKRAQVGVIEDATTRGQRLAVSAAGAARVDGSAVTQPVSAVSLPLPTGAATETTLGAMLTTADFDTKTGSLTEGAPASDTASSGLNGRLQRIAQRLTSLIALLPTSLGQKTSAASLPVVLPSDQTVPVSGTFWQATQPVSATSLPLPTGAATETTLGGVLTQSDFDTKAGSLTEAAPASDTASSGLNGRLQRIAQRLTSLIALLPTSLGQKTMANSLGVTIASDQSAVPASQSGTWNVTNVSGTVSLPTGASTAAKQPALGTAGTASADVISVQGIASMTPLKVDGSAVTQPVSGTVTANVGTTGALALDATLTGGTQQARVTDGTTVASVQAIAVGQNALTTAGGYKEVSFSTTTAQAVASTDVSAYRWVCVQIIAQGTNSVVTFQGSNDNTNWKNAVLMDIGSITSNNTTNTTGTGIWHGPIGYRYFRLNVTAITALTTSGLVEFYTEPTTPPSIGVVQLGTWTVQPGNTANSTPWLVTTTPTTSGGYTVSRLISAATTNATVAKGSGGQLYGWYLSNSNAAARYLKLYNKATAPTVGTDTPVMTLMIPAGSAANVEYSLGIAFATGISYATTTGATDADTGAVAANEIIANLLYK